jgi:hypothetical protein
MNLLVKRFLSYGVMILMVLALSLLPARRRNAAGAEALKPPSEGVAAQKLSILLQIAADTNSPIKFDRKFNEFQLVYTRSKDRETTVVTRPIKFCPWTGIRLPESGRAAAFEEPSRREREWVIQRLQNASTIEAISRALGKADLTFGRSDSFQQQLTYTNLAKTFDVIVQQSQDGQASVFFLPKAKKENEPATK